MLSISVGDVLEQAASVYLNDKRRQIYTNEVLLPAFKTALTDLKQELFDNDISINTEVSKEYTVLAGIKDIGGPTGPALPFNFVVPTACWEKEVDTTDNYSLMGQMRILPKWEGSLVPQLMYWSYSKQYIHFLGATSDRNVKIDFIADNMTFAETAESQINLFNAFNFLSYRTAAVAAEFFGENESRATKLNTYAQSAIDHLLNIDIKNQQSMPVRRRPFMSRYKSSNNNFYM